MLNSSNRLSNALQTVISMFLHAANAPETVHELLARMGLATSTTTTHNAINNLAIQAKQDIRTLGQTMQALYSFDNVDIFLRHATPSITHEDSLIHLTSAISFPLNNVSANDLRCSDSLKSRISMAHDARMQGLAPVSPKRLADLYREPHVTHPSGLRHRQCFHAYMFLRNLIEYGPAYFRQFKNTLPEPEAVEQIPLAKTEHVPLMTLEVNPSTVSGNAEVLTRIFRQAGIGDVSEDSHVQDIGGYVVLVSGDLLTGDRIRSLQNSRSAEATKWPRLDFIVFIMGLFHLKMACADATGDYS